MTVPPFPTSSGLLQYKVSLRDNLIIAGQDKGPTQAIAWLFAVGGPEATFESLAEVEPGFGTLDRKLTVALRAKLPPTLSHRLNALELKSPTKIVTGRQILLMSYQQLTMTSHHTSVFSMKALMGIQCMGDNRKEAFRNEWNSVLARSGAQEVGNVTRTELLMTALGSSRDLAVSTDRFRAENKAQ